MMNSCKSPFSLENLAILRDELATLALPGDNYNSVFKQ